MVFLGDVIFWMMLKLRVIKYEKYIEDLLVLYIGWNGYK